MNAGIYGFGPSKPYKIIANPVFGTPDGFEFPVFLQLNAECFLWNNGEEEEVLADKSLYSTIKVLITTCFQSASAKLTLDYQFRHHQS